MVSKRTKAPRKSTTPAAPAQPRNVHNDVIFILLVPILFVVLILGSAFLYITIKNGESPSADALTTIFKHIIDLLAGLLGPKPTEE